MADRYESERVSGAPSGVPEFQAAIKRLVPQGFTFKGSPHFLTRLDARAAMSTLMRSELGLDILQSRGGQASP